MFLLALLFNTFFSTYGLELPTLNINSNEITISGVSSGGYMAVQMQVAHSKVFKGVGVVAGGLYWCAQGDSNKAQSSCMNFARADVGESIAEAQRLADEGLIDPLANIAQQNIYIYASPTDYVISPNNSEKLLEFYQAFRDTESVQFENSLHTAHGFPTLDYGALCLLGGSPWLLNCDIDLAGVILQNMYGELNERSVLIEDRLFEFSQEQYTTEESGLYENGWVYIPQACEMGINCPLHIALHGCQMNSDYIQDQFARYSGYNEWAEANDIVVLYPQAAKVTGPNPYGCWDWFGFTSSDYVNKQGLQVQALVKMIKKIADQ